MARRSTKPAESDPVDANTVQAGPEIDILADQQTVANDPASDPAVAKQGAKAGLTLVLGAVLGMGAAALGYGAALKFPLAGQTAAPPESAGVSDAALTELAAKIDAIDLSGIESRLSALEAAPKMDLAPLKDQITALENKLAATPANADLRSEIADLAAKVAQSDPAPAIKAAIAAEMAAVQQAAADMSAAVSKAAIDAQQTAALTQLRAALDTGGPYLAAAQALTLPQVLAQNASAGIPSLTVLRDGFADAARAGLDAALRADMGQTWGERAASFLRNQTGARSLTPRDGNDPDAILSRVEAHLRRADVAAALTEVGTLPQAAKTAMQNWIDQLQLRTDALAAVQTMTEKGM